MKYVGKNCNGLDLVVGDEGKFYVATTEYVRNPIAEYLSWVDAVKEQENSPDGYAVVKFWPVSSSHYEYVPVRGPERKKIIATAWPMVLERRTGDADGEYY